jgi:hypothetical protein
VAPRRAVEGAPLVVPAPQPPGKGKQTRVVLDDDEVSSDEDKPLQKRLRQLSGVGPAVLDEAAAADKEAADKRATEEATTKRATEEAAAKATAAEAAGTVGGSPDPSQAPSAPEAKRAAAPSGSTPPVKRPYRGVWKPQFVHLSLPLFPFFVASFSYYPFCPFWLLALGERSGHNDLHGSYHLSVIPYVHGRTELYYAQAYLA